MKGTLDCQSARASRKAPGVAVSSNTGDAVVAAAIEHVSQGTLTDQVRESLADELSAWASGRSSSTTWKATASRS